MSFLTEYFDEYRTHPIKNTKICRPEHRWPELPGNWYEHGASGSDADLKSKWTEEETNEFIKETMRSLRGQSSYFNHYCAHLNQEFATRPFIPRLKKRIPCRPELAVEVQKSAPVLPPITKLAIKDTELMKEAKELYERDINKPPLKPLLTHARILSYVRPCRYHTGLSEYQVSISRLAYELVRDDRIPRYHAHNGDRPRWGIPPEGKRQPMLDAVPFDGEKLLGLNEINN